jgi:hypothetical protein
MICVCWQYQKRWLIQTNYHAHEDVSEYYKWKHHLQLRWWGVNECCVVPFFQREPWSVNECCLVLFFWREPLVSIWFLKKNWSFFRCEFEPGFSHLKPWGFDFHTIFSNSRTFGSNSKPSLVPYRYYTFLYARYCIDILYQIKIRVYVDIELNNTD